LIELLVASAIALVVLGGVFSMLILSQRQQSKEVNYALAQSSAQQQLDTMVSQIRQAWNIVSSGPNSVDMDVNLAGSPVQVYYECDIPSAQAGFNECVRLQTSVGAALPSLSSATTVVPLIANGTSTDPVFSWGPSAIAPYYMTATIKVPASEGAASSLSLNHTIVFSDGALMRNENVQN
jgi:Tfp pilus assembly protein PilW